MEISQIIDDLSITLDAISMNAYDEAHCAAFTNEFFPQIVRVLINRK